jgi:hypothetical protein
VKINRNQFLVRALGSVPRVFEVLLIVLDGVSNSQSVTVDPPSIFSLLLHHQPLRRPGTAGKCSLDDDAFSLDDGGAL